MLATCSLQSHGDGHTSESGSPGRGHWGKNGFWLPENVQPLSCKLQCWHISNTSTIPSFYRHPAGAPAPHPPALAPSCHTPKVTSNVQPLPDPASRMHPGCIPVGVHLRKPWTTLATDPRPEWGPLVPPSIFLRELAASSIGDFFPGPVESQQGEGEFTHCGSNI